MRTFDEMYLNSPAEGAAVRDHYRDYAQWLGKQSQDYLRARSAEAEIVFRRVGITFAVYGDKDIPNFSFLTSAVAEAGVGDFSVTRLRKALAGKSLKNRASNPFPELRYG